MFEIYLLIDNSSKRHELPSNRVLYVSSQWNYCESAQI